MAILNDLIVRGATRCLNTLYANSLQVDSQTISGNLTVNGYTYMGYSTSRSDTKLSVAGITNNQWYRSTGSVGWYSDSYGGGIYMTDPTYVKTYNNKAFYAYNGLYTGSTQQYYLNVNGKLNAADGVFSNNLNVGNSLVGRNISATNLLRAAKYDLQTITQVGSNGTLYVAPSIQFPTSNTTSVTAASTSITIIDTNITSDVMAGVVWRPSAKVKISGTINGVVTGTVDGTITSINTSSKTMVIGNLSGGNWSSVVAGTYTKDKIENLNIMMYETYQNSTYYPVGILLTSYGSVGEHTDGTAKTFIDIFGGSATKPVVRLGSMTGLDAINGVTPSGWGLYTSNGYFSGLIVSTSGKIGGWSLSTNSLTTGTWGSSGSAMLCTGSTGQKAIGGSPASTSGWVFTAGANFGVTSSGALYANSAHISGEITATSGTIGGASITDGTLLIKDANISGKISANHIDVSSITIGSLSGADNYALKDDIPTTVSQLTDSGNYLTTTTAANIYATQTAANNAAQTASKYITAVDANGIRVHAENNPTTNYALINANGMSIYQNASGTAAKVADFNQDAVAFYDGNGDDDENIIALFGKDGGQVGYTSSNHLTFSSNSITAVSDISAKLFSVGTNQATEQVLITKDLGTAVKVTSTSSSNPTSMVVTLPITDEVTGGTLRIDYEWYGYSSDQQSTFRYRDTFEGVIGTAKSEDVHADRIGLHLNYSRVTMLGKQVDNFWVDAYKTSSYNTFFRVISVTYDGNMAMPTYDLGTRAVSSNFAGSFSSIIGESLFATGDRQVAIGKYNVEDTNDTYAFIVGNGNDDDNRSNALTVDWNGNLNTVGAITQNGTAVSLYGHSHTASAITMGTLSIERGGSGNSGTTSTTTIEDVATAGSGYSVTQAQFCSWGKVATIHLAVKKNSSAGSGTQTICTLKSGYRPKFASPGNYGYASNCVIATDGAITISGSVAANATLQIYATFVLA